MIRAATDYQAPKRFRSRARVRRPLPTWTPEYLAGWMKEHGWSVPRLAYYAGVSERSLRRYLKGESPIPRPFVKSCLWSLRMVKRPVRNGGVGGRPRKRLKVPPAPTT